MDRVPAWHRAHLKNHCHFGSTNRQAALLGKNPDTSCAAWNLQIFSHISLKIGTISTITDGQDVPSTPFLCLMIDVCMDLLISRTSSAFVMARLLSLMACLDPTLWDNRHKLDEKTKTFASEQSQTDDDMTLAFNAGWEWSGQYIGCAKWFTFLLQAFENAGRIVGIFLMPANLKYFLHFPLLCFRMFFLHFWQCLTNWMFWHFDNFDNLLPFEDAWDLWHLRHWLQFWQLRTWIHDNLCDLTIKSDTGQHSQFLQCFCNS